MRACRTFSDSAFPGFRQKLLRWGGTFGRTCVLDSNGYDGVYEILAGVGAVDELILENDADTDAFDKLRAFRDKSGDWIFGFLTYDLKNSTERLSSGNFDGIGMPALHFFVPEYLFLVDKSNIRVACHLRAQQSPEEVMEAIQSHTGEAVPEQGEVRLRSRLSREQYLEAARKVIGHIARGDIYEMNFCQEFYAERVDADAVQLFEGLRSSVPAPFSCYYRLGGKHLISASPERFLKKRGSGLISQPMKGTARRSADPQEDLLLRQTLQADPKERSENVMIVDIVRNDVSRIARRGSVNVDELFGVYSFSHVHQMISTVSAELVEGASFADALKHTFPMGSMTGAPKIRAMELIERYETTKRGLFSGAVGYIDPDANFDFNVVIRSMLYNAEAKYLSVMAGSALTINSDIEKEYEECLLKAEGVWAVAARLSARQVGSRSL